MFNSIPSSSGGSSGGSTVDAVARAAAAAAQASADGIVVGLPQSLDQALIGPIGRSYSNATDDEVFDPETQAYSRGYALLPFCGPAGSTISSLLLKVAVAYVYDEGLDDYAVQALGGFFRVAIYDTDPDTGRPGNRVWQSVELPSTAFGIVVVEVPDIAMTGIMWAGVRRRENSYGAAPVFAATTVDMRTDALPWIGRSTDGFILTPSAISICSEDWSLVDGRWTRPSLIDESVEADTQFPTIMPWPEELEGYNGEPVSYYAYGVCPWIVMGIQK